MSRTPALGVVIVRGGPWHGYRVRYVRWATPVEALTLHGRRVALGKPALVELPGRAPFVVPGIRPALGGGR